MDEIRKFLEDVGIHIGLITAGFFGAYVSINVNNELNRWQKVTVVISGMAAANYLTPVVFNYLDFVENIRYGAAFLIGFGGLKFVEYLIVKIRENADRFSPKNEDK